MTLGVPHKSCAAVADFSRPSPFLFCFFSGLCVPRCCGSRSAGGDLFGGELLLIFPGWVPCPFWEYPGLCLRPLAPD